MEFDQKFSWILLKFKVEIKGIPQNVMKQKQKNYGRDKGLFSLTVLFFKE